MFIKRRMMYKATTTILASSQRRSDLLRHCENHWTRRTSAQVVIRSYFTNGDRMKKDDPYAQLGLQWGDGASTQQIKDAFRLKARELHPDVNTQDTPEQAIQKFQRLQKAYETLMGIKNAGTTGGSSSAEALEEWQFSIWRNGDRIAQDRTDVAGVARKRPVPPASSQDSNGSSANATSWAGRHQLGHPSGRGSMGITRGEYLGEGSSRSSSVGRGQNKWVKPKEYKPWNPNQQSSEKKHDNKD